MRRTYTREEYFEKISWIRAARRPISITTRCDRRFSGESEEDFERLHLSTRVCRIRRRICLHVFAPAEYVC